MRQASTLREGGGRGRREEWVGGERERVGDDKCDELRKISGFRVSVVFFCV